MAQKVLLVDDSPSIHTLVRARLAGEPITVHSAYSSAEGLTMAKELLPDLVLLDVDMPDPDGFEVCRRLKADTATVQIPIVFLTGASSPDERIFGLELGAVDYVTKPFNPAELRARVRASLRTKYLMDLLAKRAQIDGLTGLWNRAHFEERLKQEHSLATRIGRPLSCVMADVDHFKSVNDTYGHPFGDEALRGIAGVLSDVGRAEDIICRLGGEEFVVLCPNTALAGAVRLAERCREAVLAMKLMHQGKPVRVTCSFGVAEEGCRPSIIEAADKALYQAKHGGRDRVVAAEAPDPVVVQLDSPSI
ncbi:MAG: diguanylate cyclase [Tepidisphaeraceae bacterium]|jgi:diguanylate cyclase (GGDEF)-like protein